MGLDYTLYLSIRDKETKNGQWIIELGYWRKAWTLSSELQGIASKMIYKISNQEDFLTITNTAVLREVAELFIDNIMDINNELWTDSIFGSSNTRDNTIKILGNILAAITWVEDNENSDAFELMFNESDKYSESILQSYLAEKDKYEIVVVFENSY